MLPSCSTYGYVYLVTNLVNGKRYVGCTTKTVEHRWIEHRSSAKGGRSQTFFHKAIRKYGSEAFRVECLETIMGTHEDLVAAEIRHVAAQGALVPKGYNLTRGGDGVDFSVPGVREKSAAAAQKRVADPVWKQRNAEQLLRQHADPAWQEANAAGLLKAQQVNREKAIQRDAHLPPEVRERRARRRERDRIRKNEKYAQQGVAQL